MKFGLSLTGMLQQPPGTDMVAAVEEALGLVSLARELGSRSSTPDSTS